MFKAQVPMAGYAGDEEVGRKAKIAAASVLAVLSILGILTTTLHNK